MISESGFLCITHLHTRDWLFSKSKAALGSIGPLTRARVMELLCDDTDKPPTPQQRVAWQRSRRFASSNPMRLNHCQLRSSSEASRPASRCWRPWWTGSSSRPAPWSQWWRCCRTGLIFLRFIMLQGIVKSGARRSCCEVQRMGPRTAGAAEAEAVESCRLQFRLEMDQLCDGRRLQLRRG